MQPAACNAAVQLTAKHLRAELCGWQQRSEIDAGIYAHSLEQVDQILAAHVAGVTSGMGGN